jgi:hypothetical protein
MKPPFTWPVGNNILITTVWSARVSATFLARRLTLCLVDPAAFVKRNKVCIPSPKQVPECLMGCRNKDTYVAELMRRVSILRDH